MRVYAESSEETPRARKLLKEWTGDGLLSKEQYQRLEQDTVSSLRTTNIFLRLVLFLFTFSDKEGETAESLPIERPQVSEVTL